MTSFLVEIHVAPFVPLIKYTTLFQVDTKPSIPREPFLYV